MTTEIPVSSLPVAATSDGTELLAAEKAAAAVSMTPAVIATGGLAAATGLSLAETLQAINGVPAVGTDGSSYTYNADGSLQSYVNNAGWLVTFAYTYSGGPVSTITYTKTGQTSLQTTFAWSGTTMTAPPITVTI